ncbi:hypothetical protein [Nonomuraea sediminis]|uniref:hypothetical protein n=1 Tax=Nonomuraea sediminis TaxID=2835864 RepID=UPI001BDC6F4E|nr:hypothetical protein [Nonomuraea sediminis]
MFGSKKKAVAAAKAKLSKEAKIKQLSKESFESMCREIDASARGDYEDAEMHGLEHFITERNIRRMQAD